MTSNSFIMTRLISSLLVFFATSAFADSIYAAHESKHPDDLQYHQGAKVFSNYCSRCHGEHADGRGKATPLYVKLKSAHPSNFQVKVYSERPREYLVNIVRDGGKKHSLSEFMPPFGEELTEAQIDDVVYFIQNVSLFPVVSAQREVAPIQKEK